MQCQLDVGGSCHCSDGHGVSTRNNWSNPDSIETHSSNVIELGLKAFEGPAAIISKISAGVTTTISGTLGDAVGQRKVDVARLPCRRICCNSDRADTGSGNADELEEFHLEKRMYYQAVCELGGDWDI